MKMKTRNIVRWHAKENLKLLKLRIKMKSSVMSEEKARSLLSSVGPLHVALQKEKAMSDLVEYLQKSPDFVAKLDKRVWPRAEASNSAAEILKMIPIQSKLKKNDATLSKLCGLAPRSAFGQYRRPLSSFDVFLPHAIHFESMVHRAPVANDGNIEFLEQYKKLMTLENLIGSIEGRKLFKTLSTSHFRTLYSALRNCVTGKCNSNTDLFQTHYANVLHRVSCPIGTHDCVVCLMQTLDLLDVEDDKQRIENLLTSSAAASSYLKCGDNCHVHAHASALLKIDGSAKHHASYCTVKAGTAGHAGRPRKGCLWCLDELHRRNIALDTTLTYEELAIVTKFHLFV